MHYKEIMRTTPVIQLLRENGGVEGRVYVDYGTRALWLPELTLLVLDHVVTVHGPATTAPKSGVTSHVITEHNAAVRKAIEAADAWKKKIEDWVAQPAGVAAA